MYNYNNDLLIQVITNVTKKNCQQFAVDLFISLNINLQFVMFQSLQTFLVLKKTI